MLTFKILHNVFFYPEDGIGTITGAPGTKGGDSSVDDLKFLKEGNEDDTSAGDDSTEDGKADSEDEESEEDTEDSEEESEDDENKEGSEDSNDDDEESEDEDEEESNEDENTDEKPGLVTVKDIKKDFPDFFKKHPEVRAIIHRERQFSEIFANPAEAQDATVKAETFDNMQDDLIGKGHIEPLFNTIKRASPEAFEKLMKGLLPAIREVDEAAHLKLVAVPLKRALRAALAQGQKKGDKNLQYAAMHIHNFIFEDDDLDSKADFENEVGTKKTKEQEDYEKKLQELDTRDHVAFKTRIDGAFLGKTKSTFMDGLDPDGLLSDWTKEKMFEDCLKELNRQVSKDPRHLRNLDALWKQAKSQSYNSDSESRIVNAALARAKQIIPDIRRRLYAEARNERKRKVTGEDKKGKKLSGNKQETNTKNRSERRDKPNPRRTDQMSELDIIRG